MSTQPIDYAALAKQAGAIESTPASVDYDALAKQAGATNSKPPSAKKTVSLPMFNNPVDPKTSKRGTTQQMVPTPNEKEDLGTTAIKALNPGVDSVTKLGRGIAHVVPKSMLPKTVQGEPYRQPDQPWQDTAADLLEGGAGVAAPFFVPAMAAAPVATASGLIAGTAAQKGAEAVSNVAGLSPSASRLVGDLAAIPAGAAGTQAPRAVKAAFRADPYVATNRALRPTPSDPGFPERLPSTLAAVKESNPGFKPDVKNGKFNLIEATSKAINDAQAQLEPWFNRAGNRRVPGDSIIEATKRATGEMLPSEASSGDALVQRAVTDYGRGFTPRELKARLELLNERLDPFYSKSPSKQSSALADMPESVLKAQRDAVADALYKALDPENAGAGPREIQSRIGDLIDLKKAAARRSNAIVAEQPLTPVGKVVDPVKGFIRSVLPGKATGAGIAFAEGSEGRSIPLLRRAFSAVDEYKAPVLPAPGSPYYPSGNPSRLLGPGPIITPPPPDTSGINVSASAPNVPPPAWNGRLLSSPGQGVPPKAQPGFVPSTGQQFTGEITDTVPFRNPSTGEIEYVPKWWANSAEAIPQVPPRKVR